MKEGCTARGYTAELRAAPHTCIGVSRKDTGRKEDAKAVPACRDPRFIGKRPPAMQRSWCTEPVHGQHGVSSPRWGDKCPSVAHFRTRGRDRELRPAGGRVGTAHRRALQHTKIRTWNQQHRSAAWQLARAVSKCPQQCSVSRRDCASRCRNSFDLVCAWL